MGLARITEEAILSIRNFGGWAMAIAVAALPAISTDTQRGLLALIEQRWGVISLSIALAWLLGWLILLWCRSVQMNRLDDAGGWSLSFSSGALSIRQGKGVLVRARLDGVSFYNEALSRTRRITIRCAVYAAGSGERIVLARGVNLPNIWDAAISENPLSHPIVLPPQGAASGFVDFEVPDGTPEIDLIRSEIIVEHYTTGQSMTLPILRSYQATTRKTFIGGLERPFLELNWRFKVRRWIKRRIPALTHF